MHKTTSRNMQRLNFRGSGKLFGAVQGFGARSKKRAEKQNLKTEPELVPYLGRGPEFIRTVYHRYGEELSKLGHEPKRCSAYLNNIARVRLLNRGLWTDKAVQSMFRRVLPQKA
jgi:hypothetical protein